MLANQVGRSSQFERRRPLFWLALAFGFGIFLDAKIAPEVSQISSACIALLTLAALLFFLRKEFFKTGHNAFFLALILTVSSGAFCHALGHRVPPANDISRRTSALPSWVVLQGTILETKRAFQISGRSEWTMSVEAIGSTSDDLERTCGCVALKVPSGNWENKDDYAEGHIVRVRARLEAPPETTLPDGFDQAAYLKQQGIRRVGIILPESIESLGRQGWRVDLLLRSWSTQLSERVESFFPEDETGRSQAALMTALLVGRRERISQEDRESFAIAGTAHLLAISGLHIQFFAFVLFAFAGVLGLRRRRSAIWVMLASTAYCVLAGANPPIVRATVMIVLYFSAMLCWREPDPLSVLGASVLLILAVSPDQLFGAGFQLSFAAVLALVTLLPMLILAFEKRNTSSDFEGEIVLPQPIPPPRILRWKIYLQQSFLVTLAATLGTAPIVAFHMGRVSIFSLWINLLAVPLGYFCMVAGGLALCSLGIPFVATLFVGVTVFLTATLQWVNATTAHLPGAAFDVPPPTLFALLAYAGILFLLWTHRLRGLKLFQISGACGLCGLLLFSGLLFRETVQTPSLTIFDIPHGRAALLEDPDGNAAMIDAGGEHQGIRIAEILRKKGIHRLSLLILTADDPDSIGGAVELLRRVPAARVILPRSSGATELRRELEVYLTSRSIPFDTPGTGGKSDEITILKGPAQATWQLLDDNPAHGSARSSAALSVRLQLPGRSILFADVRSNASLQRLLDKWGTNLEADLLCINGSTQRWPPQTAQLIRESHARTVIVTGRDPVDMTGVDLQELAESLHLRVLSPTHSGSLRVKSETGVASSPPIESFQNGGWKSLGD